MADNYTQKLANGNGEILNILNSLKIVQKSYENRYPNHKLNKYDPIILLYLYGICGDDIKKVYHHACGNNSNTMVLLLKACELNSSYKTKLMNFIKSPYVNETLNIDSEINEILINYQTDKQLILG
jgi:hypothetical protein